MPAQTQSQVNVYYAADLTPQQIEKLGAPLRSATSHRDGPLMGLAEVLALSDIVLMAGANGFNAVVVRRHGVEYFPVNSLGDTVSEAVCQATFYKASETVH